jgi:acyl-coenzyme A thioesterase PaaI-like protein
MRHSLPTGVDQQDVEHFRTKAIAQLTFQDPDFEIVPGSRHYTSDGSHTLTGKTWNTTETIPHLISFFRPAHNTSQEVTGSSRAELRRFYTFGSGLNAHSGSLHGGVVAALLDSVVSNFCGLHSGVRQTGGTVFTLQLNVSFKSPIPTPGTTMIRAWTSEPSSSRKLVAKGTIETDGVVHASCEGLWLIVRPKL